MVQLLLLLRLRSYSLDRLKLESYRVAWTLTPAAATSFGPKIPRIVVSYMVFKKFFLAGVALFRHKVAEKLWFSLLFTQLLSQYTPLACIELRTLLHLSDHHGLARQEVFLALSAYCLESTLGHAKRLTIHLPGGSLEGVDPRFVLFYEDEVLLKFVLIGQMMSYGKLAILVKK